MAKRKKKKYWRRYSFRYDKMQEIISINAFILSIPIGTFDEKFTKPMFSSSVSEAMPNFVLKKVVLAK